ncbi:hypothetical protein F2Q69_00029509 [Brassica cretica]|uniref:Uncharacterized protein n=1 Tax=Brassica cretica TaxID=69181 RepID=A0A8S9S4G3_BRACR|nr:hypothetical protein F2Q69_00029509 [Brassica cretica]
MSSSHGDKRSSDVEMGEATSPAPILTSPVEAPACVADHLSFRERLVRRQAEEEQVRPAPSSRPLLHWLLLRVMGPRSQLREMRELSQARLFRMLRLHLLDRPRL